MLQFLQYKVFGRHRVPDGWIVVTAGNPPEYNNSVREFDMATWDRLKRIDVEPEFDCWKEYAYKAGIHPAIMTYLEIKKAKLDSSGQQICQRIAAILEQQAQLVRDISDNAEAFIVVKKDFDARVKELKKLSAEAGSKFSNMINFIDEMYPEGQEMLVVVTELTANCYTSSFISKFGCKEYFDHNKDLLFFERHQEITMQIEKLEL